MRETRRARDRRGEGDVRHVRRPRVSPPTRRKHRRSQRHLLCLLPLSLLCAFPVYITAGARPAVYCDVVERIVVCSDDDSGAPDALATPQRASRRT